MISTDINTIPEEVKAARALAAFARDHGWEFSVQPVDRDMAGHRFFALDVWHLDKDGARESFRVCWHTRATEGRTYRVFSKVYSPPGKVTWMDAPSLKKIREVIASVPEEPVL